MEKELFEDLIESIKEAGQVKREEEQSGGDYISDPQG